MPVTIKPSEKVGRNSDPIAASSKGLIDRAAFSFESKPVLHYSFQDLDNKDDPNRAKVISYENGFVRGVIRAYQQDLHLVLRPDDIWLAIITQFSFYVTSHAEELRSKFVAHEGQKELVLEIKEGFASLNVPAMARKFTCLIEEHLVDKEVRNWIIPDFSTTTDNDMAVASLAMMATMKKFFSYTAISMCGFPSVTLLGEKQDWEEIRRRVDRLAMYGDEPEEWSQLLIPVLDRFVKTFEEPESPELKRFWDEVCYAEGARGSGGVPTYSGWITAFAYWTTDGKRNRGRGLWDKKEYQLDDQTYPIIGQRDVPSGVMEIPLKFLAYELRTEFDTTLVTGSVGVSVNEDGDAGTVVQPRSGWWMFENSRKSL